jgi:IclR family mhp operon transcriptional activator
VSDSAAADYAQDHHAATDDGTYGSVRSLRRGLDLLVAIGQGTRTVQGLALAVGLNRTSVYRLLSTLEQAGYVMREDDGGFRLTTQTLDLSAGVGRHTKLTEAAEPILRRLTADHIWPANLVAPGSGNMVVLASTHRWARTIQHRDMTGETVPMVSSVGKSYLAHLQPHLAAPLISAVVRSSVNPPRSREVFLRALANAQIQGYALGVEEVVPGLTSLALPVRQHDEVVACLNIVTPSRMALSDVLGTNLPALRSAVRRLEVALDQHTNVPFSDLD